MKSSILICGAGVAGLSTAHFLLSAGQAVTVVERSPTFRGGGQAVDVRGVALDVVARMGLLDAVRDHRTRLKGMSMLDRNGRELSRNLERTMTGGRFDSGDVEIFRDEVYGFEGVCLGRYWVMSERSVPSGSATFRSNGLYLMPSSTCTSLTVTIRPGVSLNCTYRASTGCSGISEKFSPWNVSSSGYMRLTGMSRQR